MSSKIFVVTRCFQQSAFGVKPVLRERMSGFSPEMTLAQALLSRMAVSSDIVADTPLPVVQYVEAAKTAKAFISRFLVDKEPLGLESDLDIPLAQLPCDQKYVSFVINPQPAAGVPVLSAPMFVHSLPGGSGMNLNSEVASTSVKLSPKEQKTPCKGRISLSRQKNRVQPQRVSTLKVTPLKGPGLKNDLRIVDVTAGLDRTLAAAKALPSEITSVLTEEKRGCGGPSTSNGKKEQLTHTCLRVSGSSKKLSGVKKNGKKVPRIHGVDKKPFVLKKSGKKVSRVSGVEKKPSIIKKPRKKAQIIRGMFDRVLKNKISADSKVKKPASSQNGLRQRGAPLKKEIEEMSIEIASTLQARTSSSRMRDGTDSHQPGCSGWTESVEEVTTTSVVTEDDKETLHAALFGKKRTGGVDGGSPGRKLGQLMAS